MNRRALVRASIVSLLLGFALGVPAAGSAAPPEKQPRDTSAAKDGGSGGSTSTMRKPTDPLGRKAG